MNLKFLMRPASLAVLLLATAPRVGAQLTFTTNTYSVGPYAFAVASADVNGDGKPDLIGVNGAGPSLTVLTNNGSGQFVLSATITVGSVPVFVAAADVNGDGKVDLISVNNGGGGSLTVLTNSGKGAFVLSSTVTSAVSTPYCVAAADVNGDGKTDLICANNNGASSTLTVLLGNGAGGFAPSASIGTFNLPEYVVSADVNGDGKPDLITANYGDGTLSVLTNNGSGAFTFATANITVGANVGWVQAVDLNGDGHPDLVCATGQSIVMLTNNAHGIFYPYATISLAAAANSVCVTNFDGTGRMGVACAEQGNTNCVQVFTNNGSGVFGLNTTLSFTIPQRSVITADFNGDGKPDLATANYTTPTITVLNQTGSTAPVLRIARPTANSVVISWASVAGDYVLQTNNNLATTNWLPANLTVTTTSGTNQCTLTPLPPGKLFFRLY